MLELCEDAADDALKSTIASHDRSQLGLDCKQRKQEKYKNLDVVA
jgi:hypothetical protein